MSVRVVCGFQKRGTIHNTFAGSEFENRPSSSLHAESELPGASRNLVSQLCDVLDIPLKNIQRDQLLLFVFGDRLRRYQLLGYATLEQSPVMFRDLDLAPASGELTNPRSIFRLRQNELIRVVVCKSHDVQPAHTRVARMLRPGPLQDPRLPGENALEAIDHDIAERACAEIRGQALGPVQRFEVAVQR